MNGGDTPKESASKKLVSGITSADTSAVIVFSEHELIMQKHELIMQRIN